MCSSLSGPGDLSSEGLKLVKLVTLTQKLEREPSLEILPVLVNVLQSLERFQEFKGVERHTKEAKCQVHQELYYFMLRHLASGHFGWRDSPNALRLLYVGMRLFFCCVPLVPWHIPLAIVATQS